MLTPPSGASISPAGGPSETGSQLLERTLRQTVDRLSERLNVEFRTNPFRNLERRLLIGSSGGRVGSHLLMQTLLNYGINANEYFNDKVIDRVCARKDIHSYEKYCKQRLRTVAANGAFGVKGRSHILAPLWLAGEIPEHFKDWTMIYLYRIDIVRQAVSEVKAQISGSWRSAQAPTRDLSDADFDGPRIARAIDTVIEAEETWEKIFRFFDLDVLRLNYEELAVSPDLVARRVAAFAKLSGEPMELKAEPVKMQADELNDRWASRFRAENRDFDFARGTPR